MINSYQTIIDNDSNSGFVKEKISNDYFETMINISNVNNSLISNYQYHSLNDQIFAAQGIDIETVYINAGRRITLLRELTDYLVKDGDLIE